MWPVSVPPSSTWRDALLFLAGLALIIFEAAIREGAERPTFLLLYAGMVGLPAFLGERGRSNGNDAV